MHTAFWTVLTGLLVLIMGQVLVKVAVEPLMELRKLIGEIAFAVAYHVNQLYGGVKEIEARNAYREQACRLRALLEMFPAPCYRVAVWLKLLPRKERVIKASFLLMGLSNRAGDDRTFDFVEGIENCLGLKHYDVAEVSEPIGKSNPRQMPAPTASL